MAPAIVNQPVPALGVEVRGGKDPPKEGQEEDANEAEGAGEANAERGSDCPKS